MSPISVLVFYETENFQKSTKRFIHALQDKQKHVSLFS
jgi:hypothetical protein